MFLALLQFELFIRDAESLKDKRRVVRSLKDKLHHDHLVSIAEVGELDDPRHAQLALALVSNEVAYAGSVLDRIVEKLRELRDAELGECRRNIVHVDELPPSEEVDEEGRPGWTEEDTAKMTRGIEKIERDLSGGTP